MSFRIDVPAQFERSAAKYFRKHPHLRDKVTKLIFQDLCIDPYQQHLKMHRLQGEFHEFYSVSINHSDRICFKLDIRNKVIMLGFIGSHDEVYRLK